MSADTRTCRECGQTKPLAGYYRNQHGNPLPLCATCDNRRSWATRKTNPERVAYQRARGRAAAQPQALHPDEYQALVAAVLPACLAEVNALGVEARLKPGRQRPGETITDRIAEQCPDCGKHHANGHACDTCGSTPDKAANVIRIADLTTGQARVSASQVTVIKP